MRVLVVTAGAEGAKVVATDHLRRSRHSVLRPRGLRAAAEVAMDGGELRGRDVWSPQHREDQVGDSVALDADRRVAQQDVLG